MKLAVAERRADLYPDRHLNVFVPYRSHDLDANVTRALVSTLRWARPELTQAFLREVVGLSECGEGPFHFDLSACDYEDFDPAAAAQKRVLGVSVRGALAKVPDVDDPERIRVLLAVLRSALLPERKLEECRRLLGMSQLEPEELEALHHSLEELDEGCQPDGWVFSPESGVCVLLECKLTQLLDPGQLQRYGEVYYERALGDDERVLRSWEDVYAFFRGHREDADPRTAFLCSQLCDYLDLLGLAPFDGFRPYDFDRDSLGQALPKFRRYAAAVQARANEAGLPVGDLEPTPTGARLAITDPHALGEVRLELLGEGVRVDLVLGAEGRADVDALLVRAEGGANPLEGAEGDGLSVRVERLRGDGPTGPAAIELEVRSGALDPAAFGEVLAELRRHHPAAEAAWGADGAYRRASLAVGALLETETALGAGDEVVGAAAKTLERLVGLARKLGGAPAPA
ncbi:MAG: hypothetical protein D6731_06440 [Planctomycetota bacterium]|nr:MAG: hypothetical protein D6731_06440 [Planctomycetota bacterium]